jgi:hypothetical protein
LAWIRRSLAVIAVCLFVTGAIAFTTSLGIAKIARIDAKPQVSVLCGKATALVAHGAYIVQNNEYDSTLFECVTTGAWTAFRVTRADLHNRTDGFPGAFSSVYAGCNWGKCTHDALAKHPIQVKSLTPGLLTSSWAISMPDPRVSGVYSAAYDIFFNKSPTTKTQPDCGDLMIWLNHHGHVHPLGKIIASGARIQGRSYDVWAGQRQGSDTISYMATNPVKQVTGLDIGIFAQDAVHRGYLSQSCYLIDVEAGFGVWSGGKGLATSSFSLVNELG